MAATVFGSGTFGTADETSGISIYTASVTCNVSTESAFATDHKGENKGHAIFNETAELSFEGVLSTADTTSQTIAGALQAADIANSDIFANDTSCTVFYVTGINLTRNNAGFQTGTLTTMSSAGITATSGTSVS